MIWPTLIIFSNSLVLILLCGMNARYRSLVFPLVFHLYYMVVFNFQNFVIFRIYDVGYNPSLEGHSIYLCKPHTVAMILDPLFTS